MTMIMTLLPEAENAQYNLERVRIREENARLAIRQAEEALDAAKQTLEGVRAEQRLASAALAEIFQRAEEMGIPKSKFKKLVEERVGALISSGLVDVVNTDISADTRQRKPRTPRQSAPATEAPTVNAVPTVESSNGAVVADNGAVDITSTAETEVVEPIMNADAVAEIAATKDSEEMDGYGEERDLSMEEELALENARADERSLSRDASNSAPPATPTSSVPPRPAFLRAR